MADNKKEKEIQEQLTKAQSHLMMMYNLPTQNANLIKSQEFFIQDLEQQLFEAQNNEKTEDGCVFDTEDYLRKLKNGK